MKREPVNDEREQNRWLANTLRQYPASADACLDAETLAAWADGGLGSQAAAAVELHASSCSRCTAVLAAMAGTASGRPPVHAWTPMRLLRWLVPLTAAATAIALWVVVPNRPVTPDRPVPARDLQTSSERADASAKPEAPALRGESGGSAPVPVPVPEPQTPNLDAEAKNQNPAPGAQNRESPQEQQLRSEDLRRDRVDSRAQGAAFEAQGARAAAEVPPTPPQAAPAADSFAATAKVPEPTQEVAAFRAVIQTESAAPGNSQFRWRVVGSTSIERSTDGGRTWTKTVPLPRDSVKGLTIAGIRAADDLRAIARMSNGSQFYTSNGGTSWVALQENSPAPF